MMEENHEMKTEVKEENLEIKTELEENNDMKIEVKEENHEIKIDVKEENFQIKTEETQEIKMEVEDHHEMKIEVKEEEYEEVKVEEHQDQEPDLHPLNTTNRTDPASSSGPSDLQEHEDRQLTGGVESSYDHGGEALKVMVAPGSCIYQPYMFEPESDPECVEVEPLKGPARKKRAVSEWCACGNCGAMPTEAEHLCCLEIKQVTRRLQQEEQTPRCITEHPGFQPVCLNVYSLQNAYNIYRADYGALRLRGKEKRYRLLAQRSLVSWCWGFLGRSVSVVLPSCAVLRIASEFPEQKAGGVGFRLPPLK